MSKKIYQIISRIPRPLILTLSIIITLIISIIDFYVDNFISFSLFYIIAIFITIWFLNKTSSFIVSLISVVCWFIVSFYDNTANNDILSLSLNAMFMFAFYILFIFLITTLKKQMTKNEIMAHFDFLTGLINPRYFYELAQLEIDRSSRYNSIFSVAYIDLDNFKYMNDNYGHLVGDALLRVFADIMKENLRKTDTIARLGGDEFIILLPETNYAQSKTVINKIKTELEKSMEKRKWPVSMSIGLVTYNKTPVSADELIKTADDTMYSAKKDGKNIIKHYEYQ